MSKTFTAKVIFIAFLIALLIQWLLFDIYRVPSDSMEETILAGDCLFVSKFHYGAQSPGIIFRVPFFREFIWGKVPSYLDWVELNQFRFPGISDVKIGDVVVFRNPTVLNIPQDIRPTMVKRCVAGPGDAVEIKHSGVYLNGLSEKTRSIKNKYWLIGSRIDDKVINQFQIAEPIPFIETFNDSIPSNDITGYQVDMTPETALKLSKAHYSIRKINSDSGKSDLKIYPHAKLFSWNADWMGPIVVPKKGMRIELSKFNMLLYSDLIQYYEDNKGVIFTGNAIFKNDEQQKYYTFKKDYYFMLGDNRPNSIDSRFWGFVPKDHIVGKVINVILSFDKSGNIRSNRFFKPILFQ